MENKNINVAKPRRSFWWMFGYILTWLAFFAWVAICIYGWYYSDGWYNSDSPNLEIMKIWIRIVVIVSIFMLILHIIIFRLKWEAREKWIKNLKRVWKTFWIFLLICLVLLIINMIYGKIQYSKIPEVNESMFQRSEHQTPLPDDEDALIQLRKLDDEYSKNELWKDLEAIYFSTTSYNFNNRLYKNSKVGWQWNQDECLLVYSGNEASCGTWVWNKETINRFFDQNINTEERGEKYLNIDGQKVTIREYLDAKEPEIRADLQKLDRILSMDYYLPNNKVLYLLPQCLQWYARGSMVMLMYYTDKEDWNMVDFIVKMNYKSVDILNHMWSLVAVLISVVLQDVVDNTVNSAMQLFPEDLRLNLAKFYEENMRSRNDIIHEMTKWEYVLRNEIRETELEESFPWILTRYPIYSKKDTKRFMLYAYSLLYNDNSKEFNELWEDLFKKFWYSIYNIWWLSEILAIMPRMQSYGARIDWNLWHKQALIENLKSGEYKVWFNEKQWNDSSYLYDEYRLPTDEELAE